MGSAERVILPLSEAGRSDEALVGGKGLMLGRLIAAGYRVPPGFCISSAAYERFVRHGDLARTIRIELGRKPLSGMRWEEIWDAALRIRSAFLATRIPDDIAAPIAEAYAQLHEPVVAVRSSSPGEDSAERSHAGLHESIAGVSNRHALLDAVRIVWASLWSDAALLYRKELDIDPARSSMAVVVQSFVTASPSGVAFGVDPRDTSRDRQVIEAVPGRCEDLVSGSVDPDRWILTRSSGELVEWRPGERGVEESGALLEGEDLALLHETLRSIEELCGWPPDVEWTGRSPSVTLLQARPVTGAAAGKEDKREWYLSLRPGRAKLDALCDRVTGELIPALEAEASRLADENLERLDDNALAEAIGSRSETLQRWRDVYYKEFIPFAHGVRQLGMYYNDAVRPEDPYEFVGTLRNQPMFASQRNRALQRLADRIREEIPLSGYLEKLLAERAGGDRSRWPELTGDAAGDSSHSVFWNEFRSFLDRYMDVTYRDEALENRPDLALRVALELSTAEPRRDTGPAESEEPLQLRLLNAVGPERKEEALHMIRVGRLSWQLRDDDNILMGRLENQLRRALELGAARLAKAGRLDPESALSEKAAETIADALRNPDSGPLLLPSAEKERAHAPVQPPGETSRQMIGQPAAPGIATGTARVVRGPEDIGRFKRGEVLVCDAIQPNMTHLVPIAGGIVERRGGMLIHGAIIARELGIPCVNGVSGAADLLRDGDLLTVDGYLGIVTIGPPEFDLERADAHRPPTKAD